MLVYLHTLPIKKINHLAGLCDHYRTYYKHAIGKDWFFKIYLN